MDITVVGSGPNGLSAAVICARAGLAVRVLEAQPTVGGGARSSVDPEFPGVSHDVCSAIHPMAVASPFFREFDLVGRGVQLVAPEISYANPLPGRPAALAYRDLNRTCAELTDGGSWRRLLGPMVDHADAAVGFMLGDKRSLSPNPVVAIRLGLRMLAQGTRAWGSLRGDDAQALFTGVGAHTISRLPSITAAAAGMMLTTLAHTVGWPVPVGGSQAITDALVADLTAHGGEVVLGETVTSPPPGVVLYDTTARALLDIYGPAVAPGYAKALRALKSGPGVAKVDFALAEDIPWTDARLARTATFHLGGTRQQMALAENEVAAGRHADWPMILAASPHVGDPKRVDAQGRRPFWTYVHVPNGSPVDQTEVVTSIVERFAPGFRDIVLGARCLPAARMSAHNANYIGGDISAGGNSAWRGIAGPTLRLNPWSTPIPHAYLCSAATPPNGGVHGMAGYYAARTVLRREFGLNTLPALK